MKNRFLAALVIIAAVFVMCHGACGDDANTTSSWLNKTKAEGIRSTWIYTHNVPDLTNHIAFLKEQGINLICLGPRILNDVELLPQEENKPYYAGIQDKRVEIIRTVVREAKKHDIAVLVMFRTYAEAYLRILKDRKYRRVVDINGDAGMWLACPADLSFFKGIEFSRAKTVASILAEEKAVGGILYETEAYCARTFYPGYGSQKTKFCYCDVCFEKFMKLNDSSGELPDPKSRYEWLCKKGLDGKYQEYMVDVYANSYRTMFTEVRKIYPETIAGLYPTSVEPHSAGFAKGTSTDTLPTLMFSCMEYFKGYDRSDVAGFSNTAKSSDLKAFIDSLQFNTRYLGGIMPEWYWPRQMAAELNLLLRNTDGYWVYPAGLLLISAKKIMVPNPSKERMRAYRLLGDPAKFWADIKKANKAAPEREKIKGQTVILPVETEFEPTKANTLDKNLSQISSFKSNWLCDGVDIDVNKGVYQFPADNPVAGKRTRHLAAIFNDKLKEKMTYGVRVHVINKDPKHSRWMSLGWSTEGLYPIYYDTNILMLPGTNEDVKFVFTPRRGGNKKLYWVRVGVRNGEAAVSVKPYDVQQLRTIQFISDPVELPEGQRVTLNLEQNDKVFRFEYDLLSLEGTQELMQYCEATTDVSGLRTFFGIDKVRISVKLFVPAGISVDKYLKLNWSVLK